MSSVAPRFPISGVPATLTCSMFARPSITEPPGRSTSLSVQEQQSQVPNLPPQDLDAEESVLGAMLLSPNAISTVAEILDPEDFYRRSHGQVYDVIRSMFAEGHAVDPI